MAIIDHYTISKEQYYILLSDDRYVIVNDVFGSSYTKHWYEATQFVKLSDAKKVAGDQYTVCTVEFSIRSNEPIF